MTQRWIPHALTHVPAAVWVRLFGEWATSLTASMIAPFLVLYLHDKLNESVTLTMLVIGLQPLSEIVLTLVAGGVTDRYGRKPIMLLALGLQALSMLGMALADSLAAFALLYVVNGAGRSLFIPASRAVLVDIVSAGRRAEVFALLNTAGYIGTAAGPLLGVLVYRYDPALSFVCAALSLIAYMLAIGWKVAETSPVRQADRVTQRVSPLHSPVQNHPAAKQRLLSPAFWSASRPALTMMLLALPVSLFYAQTETNLHLHLQHGFTDPVSVLAWLTSTKGLLAISLEFWLVRKTRHLPARQLIWFSYLCFAIVALGYGYADNLLLLLVLQMVFVLGESIGLTHMLTLVSLRAPAHLRGWYFALYGTHWDISRAFGPYLGSLVMLSYGGEGLFACVAGILLLGGVLQYGYLGKAALCGEQKRTIDS